AAHAGRELRHHREPQPHVVELPEHRAVAEARPAHRADEPPKQASRLLVGPQTLTKLVAGGGPRHRVPGEAKHGQLPAHRLRVEPQGERRLLHEPAWVLEGDGLAEQLDAVAEKLLSLTTTGRRRGAGEQRVATVRDHAGVPVVVAHEALHGEAPGAVAQHLSQLLLAIEAEAIRAAGRA